MSATILHNGQRKKIKFNSQTSTIQSLVEEAALAYELDPLQCDLVHNRKILDKGQLFRFSGVSNNATLELQVTNKSKSLKEVKIALTAEDLGSRTDVFSPSQTLRDVLQKFVEDDFLPRDVLLKSPIIVYLRQQFAGDQLETTLHSLGLDSAGGRLQLRFDKNAVVTSNEDSTKESGYVNKQSSSDDMKEISPQPVVEGVEPARVKQPSVTSPSLESSPQIPPSSQPAINTFLNSLPIQIPSVEVTLQRCQDMLNTNFDCVSSLAMTTITKYLDNLIKHPHDLKYRTINTQNPIFAENILPAKGAVEILFALGFLPQLPEYLMISDPRQNVQSSTTKLFFQYEAISETSDGLITVALLKSIRVNVCEVIMNELNIPIEKRPPVPVPPSERPQAETPQLIPFDPFKPLIIRTSVQPRASSSAEVMSSDGTVVIPVAKELKTETEIKLSKLIQQRDQLMGDRNGVQRRTRVSLLAPYDQSKSDADPKSTEINGLMDVEVEDRSLDSLTLRSLMRKYAKANDVDETPLTTKAIRDLEKIQKEVVYTETLIKIRFPDRICLEAYFHPQDTIQDVRNWLIDSCFISSPSTFAFDLYVTPPRSVLPLNSTLQELGLVPAALLYVSWNNPPPAHENLVMSLPGSAYLTPDLYHKANSYHFMEAQGESQTAREDSETERQVHHFPQGQKLVKEPEVVKDQFLADPTMSVGESDSKNRVGSKKPRWLKT